jgi:hypothetical protein
LPSRARSIAAMLVAAGLALGLAPSLDGDCKAADV